MSRTEALRFHETGKPEEVLKLEELELPALIDGEVKLKVLAAPLNPADLNFISGTYGVQPQLPAVPGIEGCGEVMESRDPAFKPGDRAIFLQRADTWAGQVQVPASSLFKLPPGIDPLQAAMLKVNPATAWRLLTGFVDLPRGSWIVQNAGNSAVGRCVIRLAKHFGVHTISLVRQPQYLEELRALGADHVMLDDDAAKDAIAGICGRIPPVLALNAVGGESATRLMHLLAESGTHVTYGAMARRPVTASNGMLIFKDLRIRGLWVTRWLAGAPREEIDQVYGKLADLMLAGDLAMPVDSAWRLENFASALQRQGDPERNGKVLFVPG